MGAPVIISRLLAAMFSYSLLDLFFQCHRGKKMALGGIIIDVIRQKSTWVTDSQ